jgi:hypothetical protein
MVSQHKGGKMSDQPSDPKGVTGPVPFSKPSTSSLTTILGVAAAALSIVAGVYLFFTESASEDATIFDALFKAMGTYFVARGLWMIASIRSTKEAS